MKLLKQLSPFAIFLILAVSCESNPSEKKPADASSEIKTVKTVPQINYSVINKYPHDVNSFTEGLLFHNNQLFESTGSPSQFPQTTSIFGIVDLKTGKIDKKAELDKAIYFGEGIVILNDKICQVTYTNQTGFTYDAKTYKKTGQFSYQNKEGWGLTTDGTNILMSDGTNNITYLNPVDFKLVKTLAVSENGYALDNLNELEYINGFIYANVWMTHTIVKINPANGEVVGKIDLTELFYQAQELNPNSAETNGIAYDAANDKILVTGKMWPSLFEIKFEH